MRSTGRLWRAGQFRLRPAGLHWSECMEARAKLLGHPIHQMVIVLPLGLLTTAVIFDIIHLLGGGPQWSQVAYWIIGAGVIGGLPSAPLGLVGWVGGPSGTRAGGIGGLHGMRHVLVGPAVGASWPA